MFKFYVAACRAYFKFLLLRYTPTETTSSGTSMAEKKAPKADINNEKRDARKYDENITATLRLLRLLVKYGSLLKDVLSEGFRTTPPSPWQDVVPQVQLASIFLLFSTAYS